ncbi:MAG TPA: hypothetical protein VGM73_04830 [Candidatus Didemnitutus sp.]|jgi:hypothetical protein
MKLALALLTIVSVLGWLSALLSRNNSLLDIFDHRIEGTTNFVPRIYADDRKWDFFHLPNVKDEPRRQLARGLRQQG